MRRKIPFDIDEAVREVREAVAPFPKAAMFELAERGFGTPFQQLVACIISIRTKDEVSLPCAIKLFERAPTPSDVLKLSIGEIDALISTSTFHEAKAGQIREIARRVESDHGGEVPCDEEVMRSFRGVGPKCAHLALGIACGKAAISVDIHVHRVTNRWGYVQASTPEKTMEALQEKLPKRYHVEINRLLVPFGKHICTGSRPFCSRCPVEPMCAQVGVVLHR